jgi:hypothetical protein
MGELNRQLHEKVKQLCAEGDALAKQRDYPGAV